MSIDQYAVLGNPISHSKSPDIHSQFATLTEQTLQYSAIEAPLDDFAGFTTELHSKGFLGLNVTVPFKLDAWELAESLSQRAKMAKAVNTLIRTETGWNGDNTDGVGLLRDLQNNARVELEGKRILVMGAGGAVRGVLLPLLDAKPSHLHICNRTEEKAEALAKDFTDFGSIVGSGLSFDPEDGFDVIINGTAASLGGEIPSLPEGTLKEGCFCYDMMYGAEPTVFMSWAQKQGANTRDGLGMLVEQAAESFAQWRGIMPDTTPVLSSLREQLNSRN